MGLLRRSSFLQTATLRMQLSWTRWHLKRVSRRQARLERTEQLRLELRRARQELEQLRHPPHLRPLPSPPEPTSPPPVTLPRPPSPMELALLEQTLEPEPEEPRLPAVQLIAQEIGLPPQPTSSPSSAS